MLVHLSEPHERVQAQLVARVKQHLHFATVLLQKGEQVKNRNEVSGFVLIFRGLKILNNYLEFIVTVRRNQSGFELEKGAKKLLQFWDILKLNRIYHLKLLRLAAASFLGIQMHKLEIFVSQLFR